MNKSIKTQKVKFVNSKTLIGTVDIGKDACSGYLQGPEGQEIKPFEFSNNIDGLNKFWSKVIVTMKKYGCEEVIIGFESTGPYGEPFKNFMKDKPVKLVQTNPSHTKRMGEIIDNSPGKTDRKDPRVIASLIRLGHTLSLVIPKGEAAELRELIHNRDRRMREKTAFMNILESLMFKVFPEFVRIVKDLSCKTALYLMENYPTPDSLKELSLDELNQILRKISRGRWNKNQAQRLLELANNSLGTREGVWSILMEIDYILFQIRTINNYIDTLEREVEEHLEKIPYAKRLLKIKGIGPITVGGIIGEVADFTKFKTQSEIIKLGLS